MQTAGHRCVCVPTRAFSGHVGVCLAERALKRTNDWESQNRNLNDSARRFFEQKISQSRQPNRRPWTTWAPSTSDSASAPSAKSRRRKRKTCTGPERLYLPYFRRLERAPAGRAPRLDAASLTLRQVTRRDTRPPAGRSVFTWACIWDPGAGGRRV